MDTGISVIRMGHKCFVSFSIEIVLSFFRSWTELGFQFSFSLCNRNRKKPKLMARILCQQKCSSEKFREGVLSLTLKFQILHSQPKLR